MVIKQLLKILIRKINTLINLFGYQLFISKKNSTHSPEVYDNFLWDAYFKYETEFKIYDTAMVACDVKVYDNQYKRIRFFSLQNILNYVKKNSVSGDFAECGVWKGHSTFIISKHIEKSNNPRNFYLFDSFEGGLSDKNIFDFNERSYSDNKNIKKEKESFSSTKEDLEKVLKNFKFIQIFEGWIPERFNEIEDRNFAFVHIDVNLYEPTLMALKFFFNRLNKGGVIVFDDYGISQFPGATKAIDDYLEDKEYKLFYKVPFGSSFLIK